MTATALRNLEAELGVIGAVMYESALLDQIADLTAEHFAEPFHGRIFAEVSQRIRQGGVAEPTALASRFSTDPAAKSNDPMAPPRDLARFFLDLMDKAPSQRVAESMAQSITDASRRRQMIEIAGRLRDEAADPEIDAFNVLSDTERAIVGMVQASAPDSATMVGAEDAAAQTLQRIRHDKKHGKARGRMCGLDCFDKRLRGFQPSQLIIGAGRPSMGKTALARAAAFGCARENPGEQVVYFCLEMDRDEMSARNLSAISRETGRGIPYFRMEGDSLSEDQLDQLDECRARIPSNFILDDSDSLSIDHVERRCMALAKRGPIALIVVDYLQIMEMPRGLNGSRTEAVGEITQRLKRLAKRLGCAVLALSQLSRKVEERDSKRPMLSDLRDSGSIEQDANVVMFVFRESYYLERMDAPKGMDGRVWEAKLETAKNKMEVITGKARGGPIGSDIQKYQPAFDYISNEGDGPEPRGAWSDANIEGFL